MSFRFKQFFVEDDRCAMKVGTDGVLLGAYASCMHERGIRVLDIGTGCGLIALMMAQNCPDAYIDAIDIDPEAASQAASNFAASPWRDKLHAYTCRLQDWQKGKDPLYDIIVSNPPFFQNSLKNPDIGRQTARHTDTLSYEELIQHSARLLKPYGKFFVIIPAEEEQNMLTIATRLALPAIFSSGQHGLFCTSVYRIIPKPGKPVKRVILDLQMLPSETLPTVRVEDSLVLEDEHGQRSPQYQAITKDFYL